MPAPTKGDLQTLAYSGAGGPFVNVAAKDTITTTTLEYGYEGGPFYGVGGGGVAPPVVTRVAVTTTVIT